MIYLSNYMQCDMYHVSRILGTAGASKTGRPGAGAPPAVCVCVWGGGAQGAGAGPAL